MQPAVLAGLRRGQLLQPVPPHCRWASTSSTCAWAPPATWPARRWSREAFSQELEIPVGDDHARRSLHPADGQLRGRLRPRPGRAPRRRRDLRARRPQRGAQAGTQAAQAGGGSMTPAARAAKVDKALKAAADASAYLAADTKTEIRICAGTACHASGRVALRKAVEKTLAERGLTDKVAVVETGCHGFCEEGPIVVRAARRASSTRASSPRTSPRSSRPAWSATASSSASSTRTRQTGEALALEQDIPFYSLQERIVLAPQRQDRPVLDRRLPGPRRLHRPGQGAGRRRPGGRDRRGRAERPARPRRRRLPHRQEVALLPRQPRRDATTSSATPTRATPAPSWTAPCSRATRTA